MDIALSATPDFSPDRDCPKVLRQQLAPPAPVETASGAALPLPSATNQARWPEAIALTVSLWLFVLLLFLPIIIARYEGANWTSVALDCSTVPVSIMLALSMFAVFRRTVDQPLRQ